MSTLRFNTWQNTGGTEVANSTLGTGKILQVVSTTKTDTFSASVASAGFSSNVTGLEATITPTSSLSKILVTIHINGSGASRNWVAGRFVRNGAAIGVGDAASNRSLITSEQMSIVSDDGMSCLTATVLDEPSSVSSLTYGWQLYNGSTATQTYRVNRSWLDTDSSQYPRSVSTITVMEVSA